MSDQTRDPRQALTEWKAATGYTYHEIGSLLGVSRATVQNWCAGTHRVHPRAIGFLRRQGFLAKRTRRAYAPKQHEPLCPPRTCPSCDSRRRWAEGRVRQRYTLWRPEHIARLRELAGTYGRDEIAAMLSGEFGIWRSPLAVASIASDYGISLQLATLGARQVAYYCGLTERIALKWLKAGRIPGRQPFGPNGAWSVTDAELEAFLRAHYTALDVARMPPSRWRSIVEAERHRDPTYTVPEAARYLGVSIDTIRRYMYDGRLPYERIHGGRRRTVWAAIRRSALVRLDRPRLGPRRRREVA